MPTFDRARAAALLPVFTALAEGKRIQVQSPGGDWFHFSSVDFDLDPEHYRVAPEVHGATFRLGVLAQAGGRPNAQGYLHYVICVTDPAAEQGIEARPNFVKWLGGRTELLFGDQR